MSGNQHQPSPTDLAGRKTVAREQAQRQAIVARYARLTGSGRPVVCDDKIIYPDRDSAETAARALEQLGSRPMRAYPCPLSRRGHHHLTSAIHSATGDDLP